MPSAVKKAAQEADEMIARLAAEAAGEQPSEAQQQSDDEKTSTPDNADNQQPQLQAVEGQDDGTPALDNREVDELKRQLEKANQRWKTLQGQIGSKDQQIEQLHQLLAKMDQAPAPAAAEPASAPAASSVTKEDTEAFGEDMIDLVQRVARDIAGDQLSQANKTIEELKGQLNQVSQVSDRVVAVSFEDQMGKLFPDWIELNEDEGFIGWLQDSATRLNLFSQAAQVKDAPAVAEFFQMYTDKVGWKSSMTRQQSKQDEQRRQVAPGKGRQGSSQSSQSQPEETEWTRSKIAALYANKKSYAADEFAKLERAASKAMQENRVDYSK